MRPSISATLIGSEKNNSFYYDSSDYIQIYIQTQATSAHAKLLTYH